jgi:hypothetical protein
MSHERITRLRKLLSEAVPIPSTTRNYIEADAWRAYASYAANAATAPVVSRSWRDRAISEINRIACWYGWSADVQRHLDLADVCSINSLDDRLLEVLLSRMTKLEECVQMGFDAPDAPPAY